MGRFFFTLTAALAEMERRLIGERTKAALAHKRSRSEKTGGDIPFGYNLTPQGLLVKNEMEQRVIRYNQLPADDKVFSAFIQEYGPEPVDEQAIFRITLQRLFQQLSDYEIRHIRHKAMDGMSDISIKKRMGITFTDLYEMKRNIRRQIELAFAA